MSDKKQIAKKEPAKLLANRHLKVLAAKRDQLKNSVVFLCLQDDNLGPYDLAQFRRMSEQLDSLEPDGSYFLMAKNCEISIYDRRDFENKDLSIIIRHGCDITEMDKEALESNFIKAFTTAKDIQFVHLDGKTEYTI